MYSGSGGRAEPTMSGPTTRGALASLFNLQFFLLLLALAVVGGIAVFAAQYSAVLRWMLLVLMLLISGWAAGGFIRLRTVEIVPLGPRQFHPEPPRGKLRDLSATLRRGGDGLRYSQLHFALALRDAFLAKLRAASGFQGAIQELNGDPLLLRTLCGDEELFRFLRRVTVLERSLAEVLSSTEPLFPGEPSDYPQLMEDLLARMEAWP